MEPEPPGNELPRADGELGSAARADSGADAGADGGIDAPDADDADGALDPDDALDADGADGPDDAEGAELGVPPGQVRLGLGVPKAASRFLRASSAGSGVEGARRTGC